LKTLTQMSRLFRRSAPYRNVFDLAHIGDRESMLPCLFPGAEYRKTFGVCASQFVGCRGRSAGGSYGGDRTRVDQTDRRPGASIEKQDCTLMRSAVCCGGREDADELGTESCAIHYTRHNAE
jgi:hypothetical protein